MPGHRTKWLTKDGLVDPVWLKFLLDFHGRTGGDFEDKVDSAHTNVDDIYDRLDFNIDFDVF